jgi:hypothetical protein
VTALSRRRPKTKPPAPKLTRLLRKFNYGLHNFVTHTQSEGKHIFTFRGMESQKLSSHAKSLIAGSYGNAAHLQVA